MRAATAVRAGVRLGVDVGAVRVGVAASDPAGILATPVTVLARQVRRGTDLDELAALVRERDVIEVVVGMPRSLRNEEGAAAVAARNYATDLATRVAPVPVRLVDERLSTVEAQRSMTAAGHTTRSARASIDAAAAVVILQSALDAERASGEAPGEIVPV